MSSGHNELKYHLATTNTYMAHQMLGPQVTTNSATWNNQADPSPHKNKEKHEPPCDPGVRDCTKSTLDAKEVAPEEGLLWCDTQSIRKGPEEGVSQPGLKLLSDGVAARVAKARGQEGSVYTSVYQTGK